MYELLSRLPFPRSYVGKFLLISFIGIHVPLIAIVAYVVISTEQSFALTLPVLIVGLIATLVGTGFTLYIQHQLLRPISRSIIALREFRETRKVPDLPVEYLDEAGELMRNTQLTLTDQAALIRMKKDLLSVLSHDIRVHVSGALMIADDITTLENMDDIRELAGYLKQSAQKQMSLMNNIMAYSEVERGWIDANRSYQSLGIFLNDLKMNMKPHAASKGIRFEVENSASEDATVYLDIPKTEQILNNLIHNAIKFTDTEGSITVGVFMSNEKIRFDVTDTGIGMTPAQIDVLFAGGKPESRRGTHSERGTGLGLWICREYAEAQGGTLSVVSEVEKGSTFTLELPNVTHSS